MALTRRTAALAALLALGAAAAARAQEPAAPAPAPAPAPPPGPAEALPGTDGAPAEPATPAPPAADAIVPPQALDLPEIAYPPGAVAAGPLEVRARVRIGADGTVKEVQIESGAGEPFDEAVRAGAARFRFSPATWKGRPVEVILPYAHTFVPPPKVIEADRGPARDSTLDGLVRVRGTRAPAKGATVVGRAGGAEFTATADETGRFELPLPAGEAEILVAAPGCRRFVQKETLVAGERLKVKYLVSRESFGGFEAVVTAQRDRTEVSRTTLEGRELQKVPGTFGDPFRVMSLLPGVTQAMSLMPMPVVRGSSPGSTGFFLDQVRLPLLFHLFGGPSVVHPEFIDRVDFYPGGFPVRYGQYTGGIVDGQTRRPALDESRADIDLNLSQAGLFLRKGFPDAGLTATAAGRIGYPGVLLSLAIPQLSLSYWDYQARVDGGSEKRGWTAFVYGADDALKAAPDAAPGAKLQTLLHFMFHRADLRGHFGGESRGAEARLVMGWDKTTGPGGAGSTMLTVQPMVQGRLKLRPGLELRAGGEASIRDIETQTPAGATDGPDVSDITSDTVGKLADPSGVLTIASLWVDAPWQPDERLSVVPGVRGEVYHQGDTTKWGVDPRVMARWQAIPAKTGGLWLKGATGLYHQPPRLPIAVPGMDQASLELGLLRALQNSVGVETALAPGVELDVATYFNWMDPVIFDFSINSQVSDVVTQGPVALPWQIPEEEAQGGGEEELEKALKNLTTPRQGRSYGLEVMLRKRDSARLFGWIAYTLSRSERKGDDGAWHTFDFDRTHILNVVAGTRLPNNWELGGRLLFQTGTPVTTMYGYNSGRTGFQARVDLRVDKRAVWNKWMLDFYIDVINLLVTEESGGLVGAYGFRYVLPTVGFRAVL